jgi:hypothetical protein
MAEEKIQVSGSQLVDKIKELAREGNVRRVRIIHKDKTLIDIPLTVGASVAAATVLLLPVLAAIGAIAAVVTDCTLEIEREDKLE